MRASLTMRTGRSKRLVAAVLALLVAIPLSMGHAAPARAAEGEFLQIAKTVDASQLAPGQTFTYRIQVTCSEVDCEGAVLDDSLPAQLAGFPLQNVTITPSEATVPRTVTWTTAAGSSASAPTVVDAQTALHIDYLQPTQQGTGLVAGQTATVSLTLQVPADYPPGNSGEIHNTALTRADNALEVDSTATIVIDSAIEVAVDVDKAWTPASQPFRPGATSTIGLSVANASNVPVERLVLQEPKAAPDGATALDASNPFSITDFTGFGTSALPAGAERVQVDAYVRGEDGTWSWTSGAPGTELALPQGVSPEQVDGLRLTYTGAAIEPDASASIELRLVQQPGLAFGEYAVDNVATGTATAAGQPQASADAAASHAIVPEQPTVEAQKDIAPARIAAGGSAVGTIRATNGAVRAETLELVDADYFTADIAFGGFEGGIAFPQGATSGSVTYAFLDGGSETVAFADGAVPAAPARAISGFALAFAGGIEPAATVQARFTIATTETAAGDAAELATTNELTAEVEDANGQTATDTDDARLALVTPGIDVTLDKTVRPATPIEVGGSAVVALSTHARALTDTSRIHDIVVEDVWGEGADEFWNAFDLASVAPTQVPANASLAIEVRDADGAWHRVLVTPAAAQARIAQLSASDLDAALPDGVARDELTGIRFAFASDAGFAADTTLTPYASFSARGAQRTGDAQAPGTTRTFVNAADAVATGASTAGTALRDAAEDAAQAQVITHEGGPGRGDIDKQWRKDLVSAQSSEQAQTRLTWRVAPGLDSVAITDAASGHDAPAGTVHDAFDLVAIDAIAASGTPYSNGWYLRYDRITAIELWDARTGEWELVAAPAAGWVQSGRFVGYTLSAAERASTQGVRLTLAENAEARTAATQAGGAYDPYAPAAGTGVASSSAGRSFDLTWQLRDRTRFDGAWVTSREGYNAADAGVVENDARIEGFEGGTVAFTDEDADTIGILDADPGVAVAKGVTPTSEIFVPVLGTPAEEYPTASWSIDARNGSVARASFVRVTDPATCSDTALAECQLADPNANPFQGDGWLDGADGAGAIFDRFDLTDLRIGASIGAQVSLDATVVWLLRYDEESGVTAAERLTATEANALGAAELADVVGVSATFQAADAGADGVGGTITQQNELSIDLDTRLRPTIRSTGEPQTLRAGDTVGLVNRAFAQSYDPVVSPGVPTGDVDDAGTVLTGGVINIRPTKTVSPEQVLQADPGAPVTITLGADQGVDPRSTLSPAVVTIEDMTGAEAFWNDFAFTGLGAIALPAGATQVRVDVHGAFGADGADAWVEGTPAAPAAATVPVDEADYPAITGVRFTFTNGDDGALFSDTVPAPDWSASAAFTVQLRDEGLDGQPITFDRTYENTQTSRASRPDGNDTSVVAAADVIATSVGTRELAINKLTNGGNRVGTVGEGVPFRITLENSGTGWLTLEQVQDRLPEELQWLGAPAPVYTAAEGGTLSEDVALEVAPDGKALTFTWPDGGRIMQPGEVFTIDLVLELQPGLGRGESAHNTVVARTAETLAACSNPNAPRQGTTDDWSTDPRTCGTSDYVTPASGPNLFTVKGVRGALDGASVPTDPTATCAPTLRTELDGSFYRTPCVADSIIGGTDEWLLRAVNAGTSTVTRMVLFDQLPTPGDQSLVSGAGRGTEYRPELLDSIEVDAPEGTATRIEVTESPNVCVGTWGTLAGNQAQPACEQSGEAWTTVGDDTDWSAVTGLRVSLDFSALAGGGLVSGQGVDVRYATHNVLASEASPQGAPAAVPADATLAYNQFGVQYVDEAGTKKIAPAVVGVQLRTGSLLVEKEITGPAAAFAPDAFAADVACWIGDVELDLGEAATVALTADGEHAARVDGIPLSLDAPARCVVAESGAEFGETTRSLEPVGGAVMIDEPTSAGEPVPDAHTVTITNDYRFTGLSVTKVVDTDALRDDEEPLFGPFGFTLSCVSPLGDPVALDDAGTTTLAFELSDGETFTAPEDRIPARSECTLTETDADDADSIVIVGDDVVDDGAGTATVTPGATPASVVVTNGYQAGVLQVEKAVEGAGAASFGAGPFDFSAVCTYDERTVLDEAFQLTGGGTRSFGPFPTGTQCLVEETAAAGATSTHLTGGGAATIPAQAEGEAPSLVEVVATNTFDVGALEILKDVVGDGAALHGAGPFEAQVDCTWERNGETLPIALADGGAVRLAEENGYRARIDGLLVGAECAVTETATGGATSSSVSDGGAVVIPPVEDGAAQAATVTITNTFDVGSLEIVKEIVGDGAELYGAGPFTAEVACTWVRDGETVPVALADGGVVTLSEEGGYRATIGDLPVGAECAVTETATGGATSSSVSDGRAVVIPPVEDGAAQAATVTITNAFDVGSLEIVKEIAGAGADVYGAGPFTAEVSCTWLRDGETVPVALADGGVVTLSERGGYRARIDDLPVGAECAVTETADGGATSTSVSPDGGAVVIPPVEDGAAQAATVTITNRFDTGSLRIAKELVGDGAALYGAGPFTAQATCTWVRDGEAQPIALPHDGVVVLSEDNGYTASVDGLLVGAQCTVAETVDGGATSTTLSPSDGTVIVPAQLEGSQAAQVTITNRFDVGSLEIVKEVVGDGAALYGAGPFTAEVSCTWVRDGETVPVALADGGVVTLSEEGGYRATIADLPVGAECAVTETATGGATSSSVSDGGAVVIPPVEDGAAQAATVTITNAFDVGSLEIVKEVVGDGAALYGAGPFTAEVSCTWVRDGEVVPVALADGGVVTLSEEGRYRATIDDLPVGAECAVAETADGGATSSTVSDGGAVVIPPVEDGAAQAATVTITNTFDTGSLEVVKEVVGDGAALYGTGPFTAEVACTWVRDGETVPLSLADGGVVTLSEEGGYRATIDDLPVSAECAVTETATGGATSSSVSDGGAVVIPPVEDGAAQAATVTITNRFDVTSLVVSKVVQGDLDADGASGPFTVVLECTRVVDGVDAPVAIPGGAERTLSAEHGYRAAFEMLPAGSSCAITESETGGADSTLITVAVDGRERTDVEGTTARVDLSSTTAPGQAQVVVTNAFDAPVVPPTLPETGAPVAQGLVAGGLLLLGLGIALLVRRRREAALGG